MELRDACNKLLDLGTVNVNDIFAEHRARLNTSKGAICNIRELIKTYAQRKRLIPQFVIITVNA